MVFYQLYGPLWSRAGPSGPECDQSGPKWTKVDQSETSFLFGPTLVLLWSPFGPLLVPLAPLWSLLVSTWSTLVTLWSILVTFGYFTENLSFLYPTYLIFSIETFFYLYFLAPPIFGLWDTLVPFGPTLVPLWSTLVAPSVPKCTKVYQSGTKMRPK